MRCINYLASQLLVEQCEITQSFIQLCVIEIVAACAIMVGYNVRISIKQNFLNISMICSLSLCCVTDAFM